jgi:hypothetical protein
MFPWFSVTSSQWRHDNVQSVPAYLAGSKPAGVYVALTALSTVVRYGQTVTPAS